MARSLLGLAEATIQCFLFKLIIFISLNTKSQALPVHPMITFIEKFATISTSAITNINSYIYELNARCGKIGACLFFPLNWVKPNLGEFYGFLFTVPPTGSGYKISTAAYLFGFTTARHRKRSAFSAFIMAPCFLTKTMFRLTIHQLLRVIYSR